MNSAYSHQRGVALFSALVVMSIILLLAGTAARFTISNVKMSVNEEIRVSARQSTQGLIDAALDSGHNTAVRGGSGDAACVSAYPDPGGTLCQFTDLILPSELYDASTDQNAVLMRIVRSTPDLVPPPRGIQTSIRAFDAAPFYIETRFDRRGERQGYAEINEGVLILVPKY